MPRSIMADMSDDKVLEFFQHHNTYCRALKSHSLSPLLRNIDKPRKEYNPNGSLSIERTATREWVRTLKAGDSDYHFDVVNGGSDQLAYLIFPSKYADIASAHVESYRQRLYPRRKREAQFQKDVGSPQTVHLSRRVIANLEFMERLCASKSTAPSSAPPSDPPSANTSQASEADDRSNVSGSTTSSVTQASRPLTPLASLRQQLHRRETGASEALSCEHSVSELSEGSDRTDETTIASTTSGKSKTSVKQYLWCAHPLA